MTDDPFAAWDATAVADALLPAITQRRQVIETEAAVLAPAGSGPGYRVSIYRESNTYPAQKRTFGEVYPTWEDFRGALSAADPAAIEVGLELLSRVEPVAAWPVARLIVALVPRAWNCLWPVVARALARIDDPVAFAELLAVADKPNCTTQISASRFAAGGAVALGQLQANPVFRGEGEDPTQRNIAEGLVHYLSKHRYEPAWQTVASIWRAHEIPGLCISAGRGLILWGDDRSFDELTLKSGETDHWRLYFAVHGALARDSATAIEQLGGLEFLRSEQGSSVVQHVLEIVGRDASKKAMTMDWAAAEPRYLDLALGWVGSKSHKDVAQWVISSYPRDMVAAARKRRPKTKVKRRRARVDKKIVESMRRSRQNLERIVEVLTDDGYQFAGAGPPLLDPDPEALKKLAAAVGPLPRALEAAYQEIGGCDLRGSHPDWPRHASLELPGAREPVWMTDPFVLIGAAMLLDEAEEHSADDAQWSLPFAPDEHGKAGYSGGAYTVLVPNGARDAPIEGAAHGESLIDYLRNVFVWGGFPGFATIDDPPTSLLRRLRAVIEDI